ncbi:hypothetical protein CAP51_13370 [Acinetobacter populi]|uniref:MltA-interacting protein n=2 Tax=Acinetobacter TaxID=469 RepID=A0A1Z9YW33_9GAMM|nr:hypothetical protein CAP51_13370 [Acinetobacter populi]
MICSLFIFGTSNAYSASESSNPDKKSTLALGVGGVVVQKVYQDMDTDNVFFPVVNYDNKWINVSVPKLDVKLYTNESLSLRARARYSGDGYESKDSPYLMGMDERKSSIWLGGALEWKTDIANVSAELLSDASGNSKGSRAKVLVDRRFAMGQFGLTPRLGVEFFDKKYVDYYYGVKSTEVTANRAAYKGDSGSSVEVGMRMDYVISPHHSVFLDAGATLFDKSITDSPIVDDGTSQYVIGLGYLYRF